TNAAGWHAVWRRAADAGHRKSAHVRPEGPHARRALARAGADPGEERLEDSAPDRGSGSRGAPGGAERAPGAGHRRLRVCNRGRPDRTPRRGGRARSRRESSEGIPRWLRVGLERLTHTTKKKERWGRAAPHHLV